MSQTALLRLTQSSAPEPYPGVTVAHSHSQPGRTQPSQESVMDTSLAIRVAHAHKAFGARPANPLTRLNTAGGQAAPTHTAVALDDVSFDVRRGEIFGVLGPNGSGKSTLIRLIATLLLPDGGHVSVFGHDVAGEPRAVQALVNRVSLDNGFFKKLSPVENLLYGARLYGVRPGETRRRVLDLLGRLGLAREDFFRPMEVLSRGEQQKVAIARAFLSEPRVLLLDEPTTGLDPRSRREVQAFVRELRDRQGATVLLTTHDMHEAESLCDRVAIVDHGRIVALDTPARLRQSVARPGPEPTLEDAFLALTARPPVHSSAVRGDGRPNEEPLV